MSSIDTRVAGNLTVLVTFEWGTSHVARYCRQAGPVTVGEVVFEPAKELSVDAEEQGGGTEVKPFSVTMELARLPFATLCRPYAHAPVSVTIAECDPDDASSTYREWHRGLIVATKRNAQGSKRLVEAVSAGPKRRLDTALGIPCTSGCRHTLGDVNCAVSVPHHDLAVDGIDGFTLTFSGYSPPDGTYFRFGEVRFDGLGLTVVKQAGSVLTLERRPPPEWVGATVIGLPGCDKQADGDCYSRWNNRGRFLGLGIKMPTYNPILESTS